VPIAFGEEVFAPPLDRPVAIDRRATGRSAGPPARPTPARSGPFAGSTAPAPPAPVLGAGEGLPPGAAAWEMDPPVLPVARPGPPKEPLRELRLSALAPLQPPPRQRPAPKAVDAPGSTGAAGPTAPVAGRSAPVRAAPPRAAAPPPTVREPIARIAPPVSPRRDAAILPGSAGAAPTTGRAGEAELDLEPDVDAIEVHLRRAPAWRRVLASAIDAGIAGLFLLLLLGPIVSRADLPPSLGIDEAVDAFTRRGSVLIPALAVVAVVTFAYQWLGVALMGATPGKRILRLRVVGPDGRRPSFGRSALRAAFAIPSFLLLGLGPLLGLFTRSGRSLHDFGAGTYPVSAP